MSSQLLEVKATGVHLDVTGDLLEELGWQRGQQIEVTRSGNRVTLKPTREPEQFIAGKALEYLFMYVGDATSINTPHRVNDHFEVEVFLSYRDTRLGKLCFSDGGALIPALSSTVDEMRDAANAP